MARAGRVMLVLFALAACVSAIVASYALRVHRRNLDSGALYDVVYRHLLACRSLDFTGAYRYAARQVHETYSPAEFERLVRLDAAQIDPGLRVEFGTVIRRRHSALVEVFLVGADGRVWPRLYHLVPEPRGWRVERVERNPGWADGAGMVSSRA